MCVGHGLVSVNPEKHLIGNHMDWSRGFPWAAFGLPDQYAQAPASVATFGFGYDDDFLKVLGEPWPGVLEAERLLAQEARRGREKRGRREARAAGALRQVADGPDPRGRGASFGRGRSHATRAAVTTKRRIGP